MSGVKAAIRMSTLPAERQRGPRRRPTWPTTSRPRIAIKITSTSRFLSSIFISYNKERVIRRAALKRRLNIALSVGNLKTPAGDFRRGAEFT